MTLFRNMISRAMRYRMLTAFLPLRYALSSRARPFIHNYSHDDTEASEPYVYK